MAEEASEHIQVSHCDPRPLMVRNAERVLRPIFRVLLRGLLGCLGGVRVEGLERVPAVGGVILAPNHRSHLDPILIGVLSQRPVWFLATDELFDIPVIGPLSAVFRAFPIRQDSPDRAALRRAESLLRGGEVVVVFPEGHESLDGQLQPLQGGVILLAERASVPVVPVGISGSERVLPPREWYLRHGGEPVVVRFGQPLSAELLTGNLRGKAAWRRGSETLARAIAALAEPSMLDRDGTMS